MLRHSQSAVLDWAAWGRVTDGLSASQTAVPGELTVTHFYKVKRGR